MKTFAIAVCILGFIVVPGFSMAASTVAWEASSGLYPDEIAFPNFVEIDQSSGEDPELANGKLTISNDDPAELMFYQQGGFSFPIGSAFTIEATLHSIDGSISSNPARSGAGIWWSVGGARGNALYFHQNIARLLENDNNFASVYYVGPIDQKFHTFRIEIVGDDVSVFVDYETTPSLQGTNFDSTLLPNEVSIAFGDISIAALGHSEWISFSHNGVFVPVPSAAPLFLAAMGLLGFRVREYRYSKAT